MGSLTVFSGLTLIVATVLLYSQAAPVTEFFGPPQTIEGDSNVIYPNPERVEEMERFHRTNKDGSIEFKMALSNGHVQYQKISSKFVDGDKVQVYEGYISERYNDGRYGTRYYAADENGYRTSDVIVENKPPVLPSSGSYPVDIPQGIDLESSPLNDIQNKTKTLIDELVKLEHDLEDEQLSSLNLGTNIAKDENVASTESELKTLEEQKPLIERNIGGIQTDVPLKSNTELPFILNSGENNGEVSEGPELSTLSTLEENSSTAVIGDLITSEHNEQQSSSEANTDAGKLGEKNSVALNTSGVSSEDDKDIHLEVSTDQPLTEAYDKNGGNSSKDELPAATTETLLNHEDTTTEQQASVNDEAQEVSTEVSEILKTDDGTSSVSKYPLENAESESTTIATVDGTSLRSDEEEITKTFTEQPILRDIENKSASGVGPETEANSDLSTTSLAPENENESTSPTEKSNEFEIKSEVSTELPLTDSTTVVNIADVTKESHEVSTNTPSDNKDARSLDISTDSPFSEVNDSQSIKESSEENISDTSKKTSSKKSSAEDIITTLAPESESDSSTEIKIDSDTSTEQPTAFIAPEENPSENNEEKNLTTESSPKIPEESSDGNDKESHEASADVPSESEERSDSNKEARNLDILTDSPLLNGNNSHSIGVESDVGSEENIAKTSEKTSSDIEETRNNNDISTEQPEKYSFEDIITTLAPESDESDSSTEIKIDSDSSTEQPTALIGSEGKSNENSEGKSVTNESSTKIPGESSDESDKDFHEASTGLTSESDSNKEVRILNISTVLPLSEDNNSTSSVEGSGNDSEENISKAFEKNSSETIEETTNAIEISSEQPEQSSSEGTISSTASTIKTLDSTTVMDKSANSSTEQPSAPTVSQEKLSENNEEN